jgi:hypothetical protein
MYANLRLRGFPALRFFRASALLMLGACGTGYKPPTTIPQPHDRYVAADTTRAWSALLVAYTDYGIPIKEIIRTDHFIRSDEMSIAAEGTFAGRSADYYFDCGHDDYGLAAKEARITLTVTTLLRPAGDSTALRVAIQAHGVNPSDVTNVMDCVSTGRMEDQLVFLISNRLRIGN